MNKLKEYREKSGITQENLAREVDVTRQTIFNIEHNEKNRSIYIAIRIAKVLDSTVEEIFGGDNE